MNSFTKMLGFVYFLRFVFNKLSTFSTYFHQDTSEAPTLLPPNAHMTFLVDKIDMWRFPNALVTARLLSNYSGYVVNLNMKAISFSWLTLHEKQVMIRNYHALKLPRIHHLYFSTYFMVNVFSYVYEELEKLRRFNCILFHLCKNIVLRRHVCIVFLPFNNNNSRITQLFTSRISNFPENVAIRKLGRIP